MDICYEVESSREPFNTSFLCCYTETERTRQILTKSGFIASLLPNYIGDSRRQRIYMRCEQGVKS